MVVGQNVGLMKCMRQCRKLELRADLKLGFPWPLDAHPLSCRNKYIYIVVYNNEPCHYGEWQTILFTKMYTQKKKHFNSFPWLQSPGVEVFTVELN